MYRTWFSFTTIGGRVNSEVTNFSSSRCARRIRIAGSRCSCIDSVNLKVVAGAKVAIELSKGRGHVNGFFGIRAEEPIAVSSEL